MKNKKHIVPVAPKKSASDRTGDRAKKRLIAQMLPLLVEHGILRAALFGSVVRGDATTKSDVDLLIQFGARQSLLDLVGLKLDLLKLLRRKVDIVTYDSLHPLMRDAVLKEQEMIYKARATDNSFLKST